MLTVQFTPYWPTEEEYMNVIEALREAQSLIGKGWTQETAARDEFGNTCWVDSPAAVSYCTTGAATRITWDDPEVLFSEVLDALTAALEDLWEITPHDEYKPWHKVEVLKVWNDEKGRVKNEVLRLYSRAIEMCTAAQDAPELVEA